jgi:hypothetical protein
MPRGKQIDRNPANSARFPTKVNIEMKRKITRTAIFVSCLLTALFLNAACGVIKNPLRDYSPQPFNAQQWLAGDAIERGRMVKAIDERIFVDGNERADVLKMLGEPDKKSTDASGEIWLYRVDLGHNSATPYLPVTFSPQFGTVIGRFKGDKVAFLTAD